MRKALITLIPTAIRIYQKPNDPMEIGSWVLTDVPSNAIINFVVADDDWQPPENTVVALVADDAKLGDIISL